MTAWWKYIIAWVILLPFPSLPVALAAGHGFISSGAAAMDYPGGPGSDILAATEIRAGIDSTLGAFHLESDLVQTWASRDDAAGALCADETERSGLFYFEEHCSGRVDSHAVVDRLLLKGSRGGLDFSLGRQPVNLATTFYFSVNDFFAPFAESSFFCQYRPGVDGLRLDYSLGSLSQLSLIGVLGYEARQDRPGGFSRGPDYRRSSVLLRYLDNRLGFETVFMAGTVREVMVVGGSISGEINNWLGMRGEYHYGRLNAGGGDYFAVTLGFDHRYENGFTWRGEYLYNANSGVGSNAVVAAAIPAAARPGRDYLAAGVGYEFSPLFSAQGLYGANLSDGSRLFSLYFLYSLSDNSEAALAFTRGYGGPAGPGAVPGAYRRGEVVSLALRFYR